VFSVLLIIWLKARKEVDVPVQLARVELASLFYY
jgi:hypothetical protein